MTTQAATVAHRWVGLVVYWVSYISTLATFVLLAAVLLMPLGHMVFDYWTPKVQGLLQPAQPAAKSLGGKR